MSVAESGAERRAPALPQPGAAQSPLSIEGIQGRYLLPIVPLMFVVISAPLIRREAIPRIALAAVAIVANGVALFAVASRYY